jgi:hypothetical protein
MQPTDPNHPEPPPKTGLSHDPPPSAGTKHEPEKPDSNEPDPTPIVDPGEVE